MLFPVPVPAVRSLSVRLPVRMWRCVRVMSTRRCFPCLCLLCAPVLLTVFAQLSDFAASRAWRVAAALFLVPVPAVRPLFSSVCLRTSVSLRRRVPARSTPRFSPALRLLYMCAPFSSVCLRSSVRLRRRVPVTTTPRFSPALRLLCALSQLPQLCLFAAAGACQLDTALFLGPLPAVPFRGHSSLVRESSGHVPQPPQRPEHCLPRRDMSVVQELEKAAKAAAAAAATAWGGKQLAPLEAEDRLSIACEKAPTSDPVLGELREVFVALEALYMPECQKQKAEITGLGGLHVIGTERHESRRIDNQLRGRTGRQGDPGSTRFFLSLEDNIFRIFGGDKLKGMMTVRALALPLMYPSTAKVWQTLNIGKSSRIPNNLIICGAVHGQMPGHCLGVVFQTLPVLRYPNTAGVGHTTRTQCSAMWPCTAPEILRLSGTLERFANTLRLPHLTGLCRKTNLTGATVVIIGCRLQHSL